LLAKAAASMPSTPEILYHYAVALLKSGETDEGALLLKRTLTEHDSFEGREAAEHIMLE
jgi:hypothetical protein